MMMQEYKPTRRAVLQGIAGAAICAAPMTRAFAAIGDGITFELDREGGWIHSIVRGERRHSEKADLPSAMVYASDQQVLHVTHGYTTYLGLPAGAISSYRVEPSGCLQRLTTQGLSLTAMSPHHIAISPDGRSLAVAAAGGRVLNMLSVTEENAAGEVIAVHRKLRGSIPQEFLFDRDGVLCVDSHRYAMLEGRLARIGG
ncbi:beta-propeller fold lactonase family protein [Terriglobus sp. 2YAB30_2]|uniref:beta-propeller fold lactonase family protein n=1 Tax=unclassified Terriglobus TaxID=2628988 RepID=UPI003F9A5AA5